MARKDRDTCPITKKSIHNEASHFRGDAATPENMLRCVLYEMFTLANAVQTLSSTKWSKELVYDHPTLGQFDPSELIKRSALMNFRILYDFFYNPKSKDDFQLKDFKGFGAAQSDFPIPAFDGFEDGVAFTKESINKYLAHLTWTRINKTKSIPQAKFAHGTTAIINNGLLLLQDADRFLGTVTSHPKLPSLEDSAAGYRDMFTQAMGRIATVAT